MIVKEIYDYKLCLDPSIPGIQEYLSNWTPSSRVREPAFQYLLQSLVRIVYFKHLLPLRILDSRFYFLLSLSLISH